jgi:hypothetical protein
VAAPFLGSIAGRGAHGEPIAPPKRLIAMFTHYGCLTNRFFPAKSHGPLSAADLEPTTLAPLAPYAHKLLLPRGIRAMNEWTFTLLRGQGNDPHGQVVGSYFTCQPVSPNSDDPLQGPNARFSPRPIGPSLDHVMAEQLSPDGVPLFVRVGNQNDTYQSAISFSAPEQAFPGLGSPVQVFSMLTNLFGAGPPSPDSYQAIRGKSVIDLIRDDLDTLERFDMSRADRLKLEAWKAALDDAGTVMLADRCSAYTAALLGATEENVDAAAERTTDVLATRITETLDGADIYSNLAVVAAACNANPVIFLKYPPLWTFHGLGLTNDTHGLSHRLGNANFTGICLPGALTMLETIDRYYAQKFAHLVAQLDSIYEDDGRSLLDNSAVVWFQEMSDGLAHNLNNLPIVQVGSAGGYFKTGVAVNVEDGTDDLTSGNSESVCAEGTTDEVDGTTQSTGTDAARANAPINKYFCNLMNALGVKAGPDGFPAVGGTAEVTHFGRYDKTEDFIGGDVNPPMIHSPGEYSALKA